VQEIWGFDKKLDDGLPGRGKVMTYSGCSEARDPDNYDSPYDLDMTVNSQCGLFIFLEGSIQH
jgi:hypothetical protein